MTDKQTSNFTKRVAYKGDFTLAGQRVLSSDEQSDLLALQRILGWAWILTQGFSTNRLWGPPDLVVLTAAVDFIFASFLVAVFVQPLVAICSVGRKMLVFWLGELA
jgi:hypothetical protein